MLNSEQRRHRVRAERAFFIDGIESDLVVSIVVIDLLRQINQYLDGLVIKYS
jgi:hypothetical protein